MSLIDEIRENAKNGTPGPWGYGKTGEEQRLILGEGGSGSYVASVTIHQFPRHMGLWEEDSRDANARRIAAVPRMEAALLAAEELADQLEAVQRQGCEICGGDCGSANPPVQCCPMAMRESALSAFREACK